MVFCLDTSALIEPWRRRYPIDLFPRYWERLDQWAKDGRVAAPEEVFAEIARIDDDLHGWVRQRRYLFRAPEEDVQNLW